MPRVKCFKNREPVPFPNVLSGFPGEPEYDPALDASHQPVDASLQGSIKSICLRNSSHIHAEGFLTTSDCESYQRTQRRVDVMGEEQDDRYLEMLDVARDLVMRSKAGRRERVLSR